MRILENLSALFFGGLHIVDDWVGLPKAIGDTLHFRTYWKDYISGLVKREQETLWIHGSSVGELEDLAGFFSSPKELQSAGIEVENVIITASSISARTYFEQKLSHLPFAYVGPLPPEKAKDANLFFELFKPSLMIMSHNDLWPVLMSRLGPKLRNGVLWLPAKTYRASTLQDKFLLPYTRAIGLRYLPGSDEFKKYYIETDIATHYVGVLRLDRILSRIATVKGEHVLQKWGASPDNDKLSIIMGSAWSEDASIMADALYRLTVEERLNIQLVVIPHNTKDSHQTALIQSRLAQAKVIIQQGILVEAFQKFDLAFIGGGFKSGLHNVLEPALWDLPVISGPLIQKQPEAEQLISSGQLKIIDDAEQLALYIRSLLNKQTLKAVKEIAHLSADLLKHSQGSTSRLCHLIRKLNSRESPIELRESKR